MRYAPSERERCHGMLPAPNQEPSSSPETVTVIDGASNSTTKVGVGVSPGGAALNSATHRVYVTNSRGNDTNCPAKDLSTAAFR